MSGNDEENNELQQGNLEGQENSEDQEQKPIPKEEIKRKTLSITIKDEDVLYAAYMPFLKAGGLFIPTKKKFNMSDELNLMITLPNSQKKHKVEAHVVWITPIGSPGNKAGGVGVEFSDDPEGDVFRRHIEDILGTKLQSQDATHTM